MALRRHDGGISEETHGACGSSVGGGARTEKRWCRLGASAGLSSERTHPVVSLMPECVCICVFAKRRAEVGKVSERLDVAHECATALSPHMKTLLPCMLQPWRLRRTLMACATAVERARSSRTLMETAVGGA